MVRWSLAGTLVELLLATAVGAGVGLFAGVVTLPALTSTRVRAAFETGPTPEWVPNYVLLAAGGGALEAAVFAAVLRLTPSPGVGMVRFRETLALVLGVALLLFGTAFLWARARETYGSVGNGGVVRLAATAAVYALTTTVALRTV
jgi:hypothetical protein